MSMTTFILLTTKNKKPLTTALTILRKIFLKEAINIDKTYKQMKLSHFCEAYDIPKSTALLWVHSADFPAYNLCGRWYVDIAIGVNKQTRSHTNMLNT